MENVVGMLLEAFHVVVVVADDEVHAEGFFQRFAGQVWPGFVVAHTFETWTVIETLPFVGFVGVQDLGIRANPSDVFLDGVVFTPAWKADAGNPKLINRTADGFSLVKPAPAQLVVVQILRAEER